MNSVQILVLDFGSQYTQLIARRLREYGIYTEIVPYFESIESIKAKNPKGIILSGGPASVYDESAYKPDPMIFELEVPILGICYGMQYIAHFFGGKVVRALAQEFGRATLTILNQDSTNTNAKQTIMQVKQFTIQTYTIDDFKALYELVNNKDTLQNIPILSEQEAKEWLDKQISNYKQQGYGIFSIYDKENRKMIGYAGFEKTTINLNNQMQEVLQYSYALAKEYQNNTYCELIAKEFMSYAFLNLYVNEVYLLARKDDFLTSHISQALSGVFCDYTNDRIIWKIANNINAKQDSIKQLVSDTLILRELEMDDLVEIESMLLDCEVMSACGGPLNKQEAKEWLDEQMQSYKLYGFGLFAVIEKSSGIMVGQCGITWQDIKDIELYNTIKSSITASDYSITKNTQMLIESKPHLLPELSYIFKKSYWHKGLASKAVLMCMEYAFQDLGLPILISTIRTDNIAQQNVVKRLEMHIVGKTFNDMDIPHFVYMIRASDYVALDFKDTKTKKMPIEFTSFTCPIQDSIKDEVLNIWRNFANATNHFLTQKDIENMECNIKELLDSTNIIIASDYTEGYEKKLGFIGLQGNKIAIHVVSPSAFKQSIGEVLLQKALESSLGNYEDILVDCNEADVDAIDFYHSLGFEIYARSKRDMQIVHFRVKSALLMRHFNLHYNMPLFETNRLIVREMCKSDKSQLQTILLDYEVMSSWEYNFNDSSIQEWLDTQLNRYEKFGFGLWAVVDKKSGVMIGQAGLSLQTYNNKKVLGMTYIIAKKYWKNGYGAEVANACKRYAFEVLKVKELYLLINENNEASKSVANKLQAYLLGETAWTYRGRTMQRLVYRITNTNIDQVSLDTNRTILIPYKDSYDSTFELETMSQDIDAMQGLNDVVSKQGLQKSNIYNKANHNKFCLGLWFVVDRISGVTMGQIELCYTTYLEMNYMLHKDYWHKGYAVEIANACKEYAFRCLRVKKLYSLCKEDNISAQNVAKRIGMDKIDIIEKENESYVEFCVTSKVSPFSYTRYSYTSSFIQSLESLQKHLKQIGLSIDFLNILDSKEVLDLSSIWEEYFRSIHEHLPEEVILKGSNNMQSMLKQCKQCLIISHEKQNAENEVMGFLILHAMDKKHSFIEIFLCSKKADMQKEGIALLQALMFINNSPYISVPVILEQEIINKDIEQGRIQHFYTNLGFTKQLDSEDFPHFDKLYTDDTMSSNVNNLLYKYNNTKLPCFIYGISRTKLYTSLQKLLMQENTSNKQFMQNMQNESVLLDNVAQDSIVWMSHADKVEYLPNGFIELAYSDNTKNCVIANLEKRIYALQFHPEVVHSEYGGTILKNFAIKICGADNSWNMKNFATQEISKLREKVFGEVIVGEFLVEKEIDEKTIINTKQKELDSIDSFKNNLQKPTQKVLCAVSGGVDSSVVATLLYRAIGDNLIPVFVDTGLLRKGEREAVELMFKENLEVPLIVVDAKDIFLKRLSGVIEPEKKRKIIGETFIEVFEKEAKKHNKNSEIKFLAQGTLYPDVIESVSVKGPSKTIKSHHNVGGLPEWMKFELIEPLRELFKDEVRSLGMELGMPESMLIRHPFPGPGLAIRIMGEVNEVDLEILREADSIFIEELQKANLYNKVWQAFCVLLNVKSVGVMGDNRTYDNTICLRAVDAQDGMTANFSHLPHNFLESVSNKIINEVSGINRVVYDITSKPPGTIEWE